MTIKFSINFNTKWGEELYIVGSIHELGSNNASKALKLNYTENSIWEGEIKCNTSKERVIKYKYFVKSAAGIYYEAGNGRSIALNSQTKEIISYDQWQGNSSEAPFLSAPFTEVFFTDKNTPYTQIHVKSNELILRVTIPNMSKDEKVLISGNSCELGEWDINKACELTRSDNAKWEFNICTDKLCDKTWDFKFILKDKDGNITWEDGENRKLTIPKILKHNSVIVEYSSANFKLKKPKFAGVAIPIFSLRTKNSYGIGDFLDLYKMVDWAKQVKFSMIQLLPINDTSAYLTWRDSYPYNCISTLALHPIYANLGAIGELKDGKKMEKFKKEGAELNKRDMIDYEAVWDLKMRYFKEIYAQEKENTFAEPLFYTFSKQNKEWLFPYAAFCALRDKYKSTNFREWGEYSKFSETLLKKLNNTKSEFYENIHFYVFIQYHLHKQMSGAKEYAHKNGVALKGDIPIGISRNSVEAWQYPTLFNFNQQAGAPPDAFSKDGQNWGFPTYNWEEMEKDNYTWWKNRFSHFANYFDAYRIDHILGFFRIWEIPIEFKSGLLGHFYPALPLSPDEINNWGLAYTNYYGLFIEDPYKKGHYHPMIGAKDSPEYKALPWHKQESFNNLYHYFFYQRHNEFWYNNAMKKLQQLIASTNMLTCGEDLGMLNESVSRCMNNLKILSLELQIMPKKEGIVCGNPLEYPYLSVCTTSTHDCETLRMWLGKLTNQKVKIDGQEIYDASPDSCYKIIEENINSSSMLTILPLQDWLSINGTIRNKKADSERINIPSNPEHYWRYRMHVNIETLIEDKELCFEIEKLCRRRTETNF